MAVELNPSANHRISNQISTRSAQVTSGKQINRASDNVASFGVAVNINTQVRSQQAAITNTVNGISLIQTADGGLRQVSDGLQQLRELGIQSGNGTLNQSDRNSLQLQAEQILAQIQLDISSTSFNGLQPLAQQGSLRLQVGSDDSDGVSVASVDVSQALADLGLNDFNLSDPSKLESSLTALDQSLDYIETTAAEFGASANRLDNTVNNLQSSNQAQAASASTIEDADVAKAISELIHNRLLQQSLIAMQAQANSRRGEVLALLGS